MELRDADSDDATRIHELAQSTMTAAYALSPQQLDAIAEERFSAEALERAIEDDETLLLVAANGDSEVTEEDTIVGFVEGWIDDARGELRWLFVDPEHRGREVGTQLFEDSRERLRENGVEDIRATVLEANTEGGTFFERLELERVDEREIEIGAESFVEYVYADPSTADSSASESTDETTESAKSGAEDTDEADESETEDVLDDDLPGTETAGDATLATTEDGTETYLDREEIESGTEGPFVVAYTDEDLTDRYGYYCSSCGSLDTAVDESERIECTDCENTHAERSAEAYDDSYL